MFLFVALAACSETFLPEENGYTATVIYDAGEGRFGSSDKTGIRTFKYKPGVSIVEPGGTQNSQISAPTRTDMHVTAWYPVQLDTQGNPLKDGDGNYLLDDTPWDFSTMRLPDEEGCKLYLSAHWSMNYKLVVDVGEEARAAGVENKEYTDYDEAGPVSQPGIAPSWAGHTFYYYFYLNDSQEEVRLRADSDWKQLILSDENPTITIYVQWLEGDWTIVRTGSQLSYINIDEGNYILDANIDMNNTPLLFKDFTGIFEGNGYTISNVSGSISRETAAEQSLFTFSEGGCIRNVTFVNLQCTVELWTRLQDIDASYYIGLFAGNASSLKTENFTNIGFKDCSLSITRRGNAVGASVQYGLGTSYEGVFGTIGAGQSFALAQGSESVKVTLT